MKRFTGVFTPIATPFRSDDTVDEQGLCANVARWMRTPLTGLVVLGSNGEAPQLDDDEADRVVAIVRSGMPAERPMIGGTGGESTRATIAATRRAAALGADAALVRTPSFFKSQMTTDVFVRHYFEVADASPVPLLLYNVTMYTGVNLLPDAIARTRGEFTVLAGSAATLFPALALGCDGAILALAALAPDACVQMVALVRERRVEEARALQSRLMPL